MIKKALSLLGLACIIGTASNAQKCGTDERAAKMRLEFPEAALVEQQLANETRAFTQHHGTMRGSATDTEYLDIPVVVHIVHDFGAEYVPDDRVFQMMDRLNEVYGKLNVTELAGVIPAFVPYIGNMHLRFHLATKDPSGNPTRGITRRRSYLTTGGDDQAKFDYWPNNRYLNIWAIRFIGDNGNVAAYSQYPQFAAFRPWYDGLITNYQYLTGGNTVPHEIGHYLNLQHTFGNTNSPGIVCDDDDVDDTPPTKGQLGNCPVNELSCVVPYFANGIDYPDTSNVQNIMNYAACDLMFTKGQADRTRAALRSNVSGRSTLWTPQNLTLTGALAARPVMPPVADFSNVRYFGCANTNVFTFINRSWNDTVNSVNWTFSNGASVATATTNTVPSLSFTDPGWVTVALTANGKSGVNTVTRQAVYVADPVATNPSGYGGEFGAGTDEDKYPVFNYYNTSRGWGITNSAGVYDQYSMKYTNNDNRTGNVEQASGMPLGDYSDFFTPGFDISGSQFATTANLSFFTAGAYRRSNNANDLLEITYSIDCGASWRKLDSIKGGDIANNSVRSADFTPSGTGEWRLQSAALPLAAKTARTFFRFRYRPGVDANEMGNGNNFYIDRLVISANAAGIDEHQLAEHGIAIAPNPTTGNAFVVLSEKNTGVASVRVTDITGKLVYSTTQTLSGNTQIEIPAAALTVKGMYLVQVLTGSKPYVRKLIVY